MSPQIIIILIVIGCIVISILTYLIIKKCCCASGTATGPPYPPPPSPSPYPPPPSPSGKIISALNNSGKQVDWFLIMKLPSETSGEKDGTKVKAEPTWCNCEMCTDFNYNWLYTSDTKLKRGDTECPIPENIRRDNPKVSYNTYNKGGKKIDKNMKCTRISGNCYYYADSNNNKLTFQNGCLNNSNNALMKTINQLHLKDAKYGIWSDQPDGVDMSIRFDKVCQTPKAHSKGMVCYNENGGFVLNASTPRFPTQLSPDSPLGCQKDENTKFAQHLFCMSFDMENIMKWGNAIKNSRLCGWKPWSCDQKVIPMIAVMPGAKLGPIVIQPDPGEGGESKNVDLYTRKGTKIILSVKGGTETDNYSPWSIVSAGVNHPLLVTSWTGIHSKENSAVDWGIDLPCFPGSMGLTQIKSLKLKTPNNPNYTYNAYSSYNHAKWAISEPKDSKWVTFGSMNNTTSQSQRGGDFYSMENQTLHDELYNWVDSTVYTPPCIPKGQTACSHWNNPRDTPIPVRDCTKCNEALCKRKIGGKNVCNWDNSSSTCNNAASTPCKCFHCNNTPCVDNECDYCSPANNICDGTQQPGVSGCYTNAHSACDCKSGKPR